MTPLRQKFIEDMILAGFSKGTQQNYVYAFTKGSRRRTCSSLLSEFTRCQKGCQGHISSLL